MKKLFLLILALSALVVMPVFAQDDAWPRTLIDGLGNEVTIAAEPQRIVSLNLAVDEILLPAIGPERFAAVTALSRDPAISNVSLLSQRVENAIVSSQDVEQIIGLEPDLVFAATFTDPAILQQLTDAGITVFTTPYAIGLDAVKETVTLVGAAVGAESAVADQLAALDADLAEVDQAVLEHEESTTVLYLTPGNYTSGVDSTISEVITLAGGVDAAAAGGLDAFTPVSDEFIIEQNPDVILLTGWTPYDPGFVEAFMSNPAYAGLSAIENGRVYIANDAHLTTTTQFIGEGVKDVASLLYPDEYPAFPITVRDAQGRAITINERPEFILVEPGMFSSADYFLVSWNNDDIRVVYGVTEALGEVDLAFVTEPVEGFDMEKTVLLYPEEDNDSALVTNILLIGEAMGERGAALQAANSVTDFLEAQAAGEA